MKTRNQWIFMLAACLCGALFCTQVSAKVCFVGDPDCTQGAEFEEYTPPATDNLCAQEGYNEKPSDCLADGRNIGAVCPYDASYVKCCGPEFAYQTCVFPLENVSNNGVIAKCGNLYKCQCAEEYKTPAEWATAASSACQPGGGVCILSTDTTVRYNKCICDVNYFPYEGTSCPNDMILVESCKDSDGNSRVSCQCPSGYRTCTFGGAPGAKSCKQGGLILYNSCKSAEDECENAGYFKDCYTQTCYHDTNSTEKVKKTYPTSCEDSYEACPHAYGYYKCRWSAANYCAAKNPEMTNYSKKLPTNCTKDGIQGTVIPCYLGSSTREEDYLGYYQCKLTCEQQVRGAFSQGFLQQDINVANSTGVVGFVRVDGTNKHLYITDDIVWPPVRTGNAKWSNTGSKVDYASINGIQALYDFDSTRYSSCQEDRSDIASRPVIKLDGMLLGGTTYLLDKDMSDIGIQPYSSNLTDGEGFGEQLRVGNHTWHNVTLINNSPPSDVHLSDSEYYPRLDNKFTQIVVANNNVLKFTGRVGLRIGSGVYKRTDNGECTVPDFYTGACSSISYSSIRLEQNSVVEFRDAIIESYTSQSASWDGDNASMHFYNTKMANSWSSIGDIWSKMNVGLSNSNIRVNKLRTYGYAASNTNRRFGGQSSLDGWQNQGEKLSRCRGVYLKSSSTLQTIQAGFLATSARIYVDRYSTMTADMPIKMENYQHSLFCLDYSKVKIKGRSFGSNSYRSYLRHYDHGGLLGTDYRYGNSFDYKPYPTGLWYYKYDKGNYDYNPCSLGGKCDGKCNSDFDANWNGDYLCTGCVNCSVFGMGY